MNEQQDTNVRTIIGEVVSNAMDKTIVVMVNRRIKHPKYGKYLQRRTKLHAHDEANVCQVGDVVRIKASRPLSKTKSWMLEEVIEKQA